MLENTLDKVDLGIVIYDSQLRIIYLNRAEESDEIARSSLIGKSDIDWCNKKSLNPNIAKEREKYIRKAIEEKEPVEFEEKLEINGEVKYFQRILSPSFDSNNKLINIIRQGRDITEMKKAILDLEYTANHDSLTGLPNRRLLYSRLSSELANPVRKDILIFLLDLDRFKTINDTLGHMIGDILIKSVANRILDLLKSQSDYLVSRLGGDEFVVVFFQEDAEAMKAAYAKKILDCFGEPFHLGEHELFITTSIGVYVHLPTNTDIDIDSIIKHADIAMYKAKEAGRNKFRIYSSGMDIKVANKFTIEQN
jgi:diguanylate cyclase (GGDEF)-like protein/PAS domain S-box-containing protein